MNPRLHNRVPRIWGLILLSWFACLRISDGLRLEPSKEILSAEVVAVGLQGPSGLAVDPKSGLLYVAESDASRVSMIRDQASIPVLIDPFQVNDSIPAWAFSVDRTMPFWTEPRFRRPVSLAFDHSGKLYVAEAGFGGRLLVFEPLSDGLKMARIVPTPWIETSYGYTSVAVDDKGRVYTTAQDSEQGAILSFGNVIVREPDGVWWMADYGPFAEFSNVSLDPKGTMLVVGESRSADVSWYDTERQIEVGNMKRIDGLRHTVMLQDGTTLVSVVREDGTWSVVEVNPIEHNVLEWVGGLTEIGGIITHPKTGDLYVSLHKEGKVMKFHRLNPPPPSKDDKLAQITRSFELEKALPPKEWPEFFRQFIDKLGVIRTVDQRYVDDTAAKMSLGKIPLTIGEFSAVVPVIAAKVKATLLSPPALEPDPIEEVDFLLFYPNQSALTQRTIAPSISLFKARHRSGRVVQTKFMPNKAGATIDENMSWDQLPDVLVSFPSGYYAPDTGQSEQGLVRVYFLGMGLGSDYWIDLQRINPEKSRMRVETMTGKKIEYKLEPFQNVGKDGSESILVAGIKGVEAGWFRIGEVPVLWNLINGESRSFKFKHGIKLADMSGGALPTEATTAMAGSRQLSNEEVGMYRRLVLRAASRWSNSKF
jgi:DNA-binding beta-propeller fold protein YncE